MAMRPTTTTTVTADQSGSGSSSNPSGSNSQTALTRLAISLDEFGELPAQVVSLHLTVESVQLHSSRPDVSLLIAPRRLEFSRKKAEPLVFTSVPKGKYSGVSVKISNPVISYIDRGGVLHENVAATLTSSTVSNGSEFGFDSTPAGINLNLSFNTTLDDSHAVSVTPWLNFSTGAKPTRNLLGRLIYRGQPFLLDADSFRDYVDPSLYEGLFSLTTDSSTEFHGITAINDLTPGATVQVDAVLRSDGTYQATRVAVESKDPNVVVVDGLTFALAPGQFQMLAHTVHGPNSVDLPRTGATLAVDVKSSTQFTVDGHGVDVTNLDFNPTFDALTLAPAQNVRVVSASHSATTITADGIKLEPQAVDGIAGAVSTGSITGQSSFRLKLAAGSSLAQLTGQTSILVTVQPSTLKFLYFGLENCLTCIEDGQVRVQGLLFYSAGQYRLVAGEVAVL